MKKLIPALCLLLVTAVMMGTSTFAWFSMNTTVTATGMQVKAQASEALAISEDGTNFSNQMTLATKTTELYPTAMVDNGTTAIGATSTSGSTKSSSSTAISFYTIDYDHNQVNDPNKYAAQTTLGAFLADTSTEAFKADTTNYVTDDLWVKYTAESGNKAVSLTITVSHPVVAPVGTSGDPDYEANSAAVDFGRDMENAFHIALVDEDGNVWNYDVTNFTDKQSTGSGNYDQYELTISDFVTLTANEAAKFTVYGWYEGEDTDCTTANAISVTDLRVKLSFFIPTT